MGLSRDALAHRAGLSSAAIAQIESGRRQDVRLASLVALARALGVSVDYLAGGEATLEPALFEHRALVYDSKDDYLDALVPFLTDALARNEAALAVTSRASTRLLRTALGRRAKDVEFHESAGWYPSPATAMDNYRALLKDRFAAGAPWINIVGDPVWAGRPRAEQVEWMRYESMINLAFASAPATIICPYDARIATRRTLADAGHTHPHIAGPDEIGPSATYTKPGDFLLRR
jgi:transcriptional regulator with XRE-family HTH domain